MVLGKVGLTGCTGMLGRHLQAALKAAGADVKAVSRSGTDGSAVWDLSKWLDMEELDKLFLGSQAIIHAGALVQPSGEVDEELMFNSNVRACLNLGQWSMRRNVPLLLISGAIVYANPLASKQHESALMGCNGLGGFYGLSKLLSEYVLNPLREKGLKLCVLRPSSIYGFGISKDKMVARFLGNAIRGENIILNHPVNDRVDIVHAADVANATIAAIKNECWETMNISSGNPVSIIELAKACVAVTGKGRIEIQGKFYLNYEPSTTYSLDISRAYERLKWQPCVETTKGLKMLMHGQCLLTY